ncbi:MAG TPA: sigma-70 family RNA polymerase sigma factor [Acidobacteriota bacterium]|jgi:RNA polymerase sigma-70 factor (ECF subfamily)|nr:sigma-70 family RNA polymerase sigma factor [Acidobacteriota bacterium]
MEQEILACLEKRRYTEAFEILLTQYQNKVFRLACAMLGNKALAEETAQEVFIRIWKALANFRGEASLSTWIYTITRNTCLTAIRVNASHKMLSMDEPEARREAERWRAPQHAWSGKIDWQLLISQLGEKYRQIVTLYYMEDKSYQEVSRLLDLPMGTVKARLHRARKDLATSVMRSKAAKGEH